MEPPLIQRIPRRDAEFALERARADAEWLASLRAAYLGRHDVLDALWWAAHPLTPTPAGLADPAIGLRELQRAVFSRAAAESPVIDVVDPENGDVLRMREAEHRLWELQRLLAEDTRCLEQAWLAVHPATPDATEAPTESEPLPFIEASSRHPVLAPEPGAEADTVGETQPDTNGSAELHPPPRRKLLLPALAGIGLLAAILVVSTLTGLHAGAESEPTPTPTVTAPTTTPHARTEIVTLAADGNVSDPLAVLARPAVEADQPRINFGEPFQPGTFRRLPDLVGYLEMYLARGDQVDSFCLVVVRQDDTVTGSCVPEGVFSEQGIDLSGSGGQFAIGPNMTILTESFTLRANGDFRYAATARAPQMDTGTDMVFPGPAESFLGNCATCAPTT